MKKTVSIFIIISLLLTLFASCGKTETVEKTTSNTVTEVNTGSTLKLAYSKNDSLNPMVCTSVINSQVTKLVFDGLFKLDSSYEPQPQIAASAALGSTMISVTLNQVKFSDGTDVSVNDVISSFQLAQTSPLYEKSLSNFVSASEASENSVVFNLEKSDPYAVSCLDFPIIKVNDNFDLPTGSGRYSYLKKGDSVYLVVNQYNTSFNPNFKTINLEAVHETESFSSSLVIGNTAFYYDDLSSGSFERINAQSVDIGINSFVYLGFNCSDEFFSVPDVRRAVSLAVDRDKLVTGAFRSHARAVDTPFNPDWYAVKNSAEYQPSDMDKAKELLKSTGIEPASREITLMFNSDNGFKTEAAQTISENLEELGFYVRLKAYNAESYMYDLEAGAFDIYIGEVRFTDNMELSPIFTGEANYGMSEDDAAMLKYDDFKNGNCELMDFINTFSDDMPFVPLVYRNAVLSYTKSMKCDFKGCDTDVFYDIETWSLK